ncbi:TspO/MBR family protein [Phaeovulum sp.]|uniref:TspO/MBR family protein n=1 Tax=Phaeovulum sp. TaxID=2934796 RepID=UPI0039E520F2
MKRFSAPLLLVAALAFAIAPVFATSFRGYDQGAFPVPVMDPPIQPAGWAFSIWGVIYLLLLVHAAYGLWRHADDAQWRAPRGPLILSLALGAPWLEVAQRAPNLATVQIWLMWGFAILAMSRLPKHPAPWLLRLPIALYAGWLTAASGVATGVVLIGQGWLPPMAATLSMLVLIAALALFAIIRLRPSVGYAGAVIWALFGIIAANLDAGFLVAGASGVAIIALVAAQIRSAT